MSGAVKFATRPFKLVNIVAVDDVHGRGHRPARAQRPDHGRAVRRAEDGVQRQHHRPPQRRVRAARPRGHQEGQEPLRRQAQRRGVGVGVGVLRRFLLDRGELPENSLVGMVPVSVHDKSDRPGRNQVSGMFSSLHTNIEDPAERIKAISEANSVAKQHSSAIGATLLQDWTQFAAPAVFGVAMRVYARSS